MEKKIILSGIQPSGIPTLGNYVGALRNWKLLQSDDKFCYYCVANMHALTVRQDPKLLLERSFGMAALLIACGVDPTTSPVFIQSDVHQHAEMNWVLACNTYMGELNRMTQFKDKSARHADNINAGLFTYPSLMAADILLYQTDVVPVGIDQKQHVELTRDIAARFNQLYPDTFTLPEPEIKKTGMKIMSLADPTKKMSKSDENENATVRLLDDRDTIIRKFKRAVTDSDSSIRVSDDKPGVTNLISIYSCCTGKSTDEIEREFDGKGYGDFKLAVGEACADLLSPVQTEFARLMKDKAYLTRRRPSQKSVVSSDSYSSEKTTRLQNFVLQPFIYV